MDPDYDDDIVFSTITEKFDLKPSPQELVPVSMLEESFSAYNDNYTESPFKPFNLLSASQRRAEMRRRLPEYGPNREATFSVPDDCPGIYFKRFSGDGRFLYGFGNDCKFYINRTTYCGFTELEAPKFADFFHQNSIEIDLGLAQNGGGRTASILCRDFCLSIRDPLSGQDSHVLLAASLPAQVSQVNGRPTASFMIRKDCIHHVANGSSLTLPFLDHISFFLVSLNTFKVVDYITFKYDYIYLAHHLGVGLYESEDSLLFSVFSLKNQVISLFRIKGDSMTFEKQVYFQSGQTKVTITQASSFVNDQLDESDAIEDSSTSKLPSGIFASLCEYLPAERNERLLSSLQIWKQQLLADNLLLLRLAPVSVIMGTAPRNQSSVHVIDPLPSTNQVSFLVLYDIEAGRVLRCFNSADPRLVEWVKANWMLLRGPAHDLESFEVAQDLLARHLAKINDSTSQFSIIRRITNSIPLSPQQFAQSPWLDANVVRWDVRLSTVLSRLTPLNCSFFSNSDVVSNSLGLMSVNYGQSQVRFFSRARPYELAFTLNFTPTAQPQIDPALQLEKHRWCNLILHPTLPLILIYQYSIFRSTSIRVFYR